MKHLKKFNESIITEREVVLTNKRNKHMTFSVFKAPDGKITRIEKSPNVPHFLPLT